MTDQSEGHKFHVLEEEARERGDFVEALKFSDEAFASYQKENNVSGVAEILAARMLILRHMHENSEDTNKNFLIYARCEAQAAVEIAEAADDKTALAIPYFNLAKIQETLEEFEEALVSYRKAVDFMDNYPPRQHRRSAVINDFKNHLYCCQYKNGDKEAITLAMNVVREIEAAEDEADYNLRVWASGGYMRIAEAVVKDDSEMAMAAMQKAKQIIDSDERLSIRKKQWEKLNRKLGFS